jgi:hypothetical protein
MEWYDIGEVVEKWAEHIAAPAADLRAAVAGFYTRVPFGYYYHPGLDKAAIFSYGQVMPEDLIEATHIKAAAERALGAKAVEPLFLSYQHLEDPESQWVKVAYSPFLRRLGEVLNFFPGQYPGGIPNAPSPIAAMLTTGLLGSGIGWAGGRLLSKFMPERFGRNLGRTGAILGALPGIALGTTWGLTNKSVGLPFNDPSLLAAPPPPNLPEDAPRHLLDPGAFPNFPYAPVAPRAPTFRPSPRSMKLGSDLPADVPLGKSCRQYLDCLRKQAGETMADTDEPMVNTDALGRLLWYTGASPRTAAATMATMYAAQQLPDQNAQPGITTSHQLGQLAENMVGDYAKGWLAGAALNAVVGTPWSPSKFGMGNLALGLVQNIVPRIFSSR